MTNTLTNILYIHGPLKLIAWQSTIAMVQTTASFTTHGNNPPVLPHEDDQYHCVSLIRASNFQKNTINQRKMKVLVEPWSLRRCWIIRFRPQKDALLTISQFNRMKQCQVGLLLHGCGSWEPTGSKNAAVVNEQNPPIDLSRRYRDEKQSHNNIQSPYARPPCKRRDTMVDCWVGAQQRRRTATTWPPRHFPKRMACADTSIFVVVMTSCVSTQSQVGVVCCSSVRTKSVTKMLRNALAQRLG